MANDMNSKSNLVDAFNRSNSIYCCSNMSKCSLKLECAWHMTNYIRRWREMRCLCAVHRSAGNWELIMNIRENVFVTSSIFVLNLCSVPGVKYIEYLRTVRRMFVIDPQIEHNWRNDIILSFTTYFFSSNDGRCLATASGRFLSDSRKRTGHSSHRTRT